MRITPPSKEKINNNDPRVFSKVKDLLYPKNIFIGDIKKIQVKISNKIDRILSQPQKSFSEVLDGLKVGHKVSVNGDKGVVINFKTIGDRKTGVVIGTGGDNSITISSAKSAIENKMNVLAKPISKKEKKERTWEVLA